MRSGHRLCGGGGTHADEAGRRPRDGRAQGSVCQQGRLAGPQDPDGRLGQYVRRYRALRGGRPRLGVVGAHACAPSRARSGHEAQDGPRWRTVQPALACRVAQRPDIAGIERRRSRARCGRVAGPRFRTGRLSVPGMEVSARRPDRVLRLPRRTRRREAALRRSWQHPVARRGTWSVHGAVVEEWGTRRGGRGQERVEEPCPLPGRACLGDCRATRRRTAATWRAGQHRHAHGRALHRRGRTVGCRGVRSRCAASCTKALFR